MGGLLNEDVEQPTAAARSHLELLGSGEATGQSRRESRTSGTVFFFAVSPVLGQCLRLHL